MYLKTHNVEKVVDDVFSFLYYNATVEIDGRTYIDFESLTKKKLIEWLKV